MKYLILVVLVHVLALTNNVQANYIVEITLKRWKNPFKAEYNLECCDSDDVYPNCSSYTYCQTRFDICVQPFSFSLTSRNCPYGRYATMYDSYWPDPDNITFIPGVNIEGDVPNPMTFNVPTNDTLRLIVVAYEDDSSVNGDDFIDIVRFTISPNISRSKVVEERGQYSIGTLEISYRTYCANGYVYRGTSCQRDNSNFNQETQTLDNNSIVIMSLVGAAFFILALLLIFVCYIVIILHKKKHTSKAEISEVTNDDSRSEAGTATPFTITTTTLHPLTNSYSDSFSHNLLNSCASSSIPINAEEEEEAIYTIPSPVDPTGMYMNPSYGIK